MPGAAGRAQTNFARNLTRSFFETTRKRCNSNDMNSKLELIAGELRATLLGNHSGISNGEPTGVEGAGVSGGRKRARLRCPWEAAGQGRTTSRQSEPHVSTPGPTGVEGAGGAEGTGGQATVPVGGGGARAGLEIDHSEPQARVWRSRGRAAAHGHTKRPDPTPGTPAAPGTPVGQQAARPQPGSARRSSPSGPCARGGAFRSCRSGSGRRYAALRLRRR